MKYYGIEPPKNFLRHHGIKGQKWGIRRFQNKDGSLTPEGKERYYQKMKDLYKDYGDYHNQYAKEDLQNLVDRGQFEFGTKGYDIIKKGAHIQRIASKDDEISDRRKYASITDFDNEQYKANADQLEVPYDKLAYVHNYEATKDIKVAGSKMVHEYMLNEFGDLKVKDILDKTNANHILLADKPNNKGYILTYGHGKEILKLYGNVKVKDIADFRSGDVSSQLTLDDHLWFHNRVAVSDEVTAMMYRKGLNDERISSKTFNHFSKLGYDAVVDMEDMGYTEYPIILLNPKNSIKLKSKEQLWG